MCQSTPETIPYDIEPCEPPSEEAAKNWPGQWFKFNRTDDPEHHGKANHEMLHLYVGKEQAEKAIKNVGV